MNECHDGNYNCSENALCVNEECGFSCSCLAGYQMEEDNYSCNRKLVIYSAFNYQVCRFIIILILSTCMYSVVHNTIILIIVSTCTLVCITCCKCAIEQSSIYWVEAGEAPPPPQSNIIKMGCISLLHDQNPVLSCTLHIGGGTSSSCTLPLGLLTQLFLHFLPNSSPQILENPR